MIEDFSAYFDSGVWVGGAQICVPLFLFMTLSHEVAIR
jgi:hypothetical protein